MMNIYSPNEYSLNENQYNSSFYLDKKNKDEEEDMNAKTYPVYVKKINMKRIQRSCSWSI